MSVIVVPQPPVQLLLLATAPAVTEELQVKSVPVPTDTVDSSAMLADDPSQITTVPLGLFEPTGIGFTVSVIVKVLPLQEPTLGVTVYVTVCIAFTLFELIACVIADPLPLLNPLTCDELPLAVQLKVV